MHGPSEPFAGGGRRKELSQGSGAADTKLSPPTGVLQRSLPAAVVGRTSGGCRSLVSEFCLFKRGIN